MEIRSKYFPLLFLFLTLFLITSCNNSKATFEERGENMMGHSRLLKMYDRDGFQEVLILSKPDSEDVVAHYFLVPDGLNLPDSIPEGVEVLRTPLKSWIVDSEVYVSAIEELGAADSISGVFDASFISSQSIRSKIDEGRISDVGSPSTPNTEKILALAPSAITLSYFEGMDAKGLDKLGVPIIKMYDLQEQTPLGRAEWLRFIGRLSGQGEKSDSIFNQVANSYNKLKEEAAGKTARPKVLTDLIYNGVWYASGGDSYQANLIKDAGGNYFMGDDKSPGTLNLSMEQVLQKANDADIWLIKVFGEDISLKSLTDRDSRYSNFKPYKEKTVYYSNTQNNSLFRDFPFHPDLLLGEYIILFNGDQDKKGLKYFKKASE